MIKKEKKQAIKIMQEFVNGNINSKQFWDIYVNNKIIKKLLLKNMQDIDKISYFNPLSIEEKIDISSAFDKYQLYEMIRRYLFRNKIPYNTNGNKEFKLMHLIEECQPTWVDIRNMDFWKKFMSEISELNLTNKKIIKQKILSSFKYSQKPPLWLQSAEWPLNDNLQPLKFIEQKNVNDNCVQYKFLDEYTNKVTLIEQDD